MTDYVLIADRFTHIVTEGKSHDIVSKKRYNKGDVLPSDLSESEVERLLSAGAIAPAGADEEDFEAQDEAEREAAAQAEAERVAEADRLLAERQAANPDDEDPTNVGTVVHDLNNSGEDDTDDDEGAPAPTDAAPVSPEPSSVPQATGGDRDYDTWDYDRIKTEAASRQVTGPDGSLKKKDLLAAIKAHDEQSA